MADKTVDPAGENLLAVLSSLLERGLQAKNAFHNTDTEITRDGRRIILPAEPQPMTYTKAIEVLARKQKEQEQTISFQEIVDAFPFDGAHALMKVLQSEYGWAEAVPTPGFWGPEPPHFLDVQTGPKRNDRIKVIWGRFRLPGIETDINCGMKLDERDGRPQFVILGTIKKLHLPVVELIADLVRAYVAEHSIYRGKAITLTVDRSGEIDYDTPPHFHDTSKVAIDDLIFTDLVNEQIRTNLLMPLMKTARCREHGVPLKRGVALAGPYGTGKTLCGDVMARIAQENGWTFILLPRVHALKQALAFARMYQPAVVFAEDIDRAMEGEERTVAIDDILNTIDGLESKGTEIMSVLTTNHLERINQAMLRPGRLDAIIEVTPPDAKAVGRLIQLYSRGLLQPGTDLGPANDELAGQIPAVIREVVERAKLYALTDLPEDQPLRLDGAALLHSAQGMKQHLALLNRQVERPKTPTELLGTAMFDLMCTAIDGGGIDTGRLDVLNQVHSHVNDTHAIARKILTKLGTNGQARA